MIQLLYNRLAAYQDRFSREEAASGFYQLSRMLSAGVPLDEALDDLSQEGASRSCRHRWKNVSRSVGAGTSLSSSISGKGYTTDNTIIALLVAGELSGELDAACDSVYQYLQWHMSLQRRVVTLLIYPLFSVLILMLVMGFLFVSVVPSLEGYLLSAGGQLPWHTRMLIDVSNGMKNHYLLISCLGVAGTGIVFSLRLTCSGIRRVIDGCVQRLPLLGLIITRLELSRYVRCVAHLHSNGVVLEKALYSAEAIIGNSYILAELASVRESLISGKTLAESMRGVTILPALFKRLVSVGERSGTLDEVLTFLAEQQSSLAESSINRIEQLIAPAALLVAGSMLLWIVMSILGPVYKTAIVTAIGAI